MEPNAEERQQPECHILISDLSEFSHYRYLNQTKHKSNPGDKKAEYQA